MGEFQPLFTRTLPPQALGPRTSEAGYWHQRQGHGDGVTGSWRIAPFTALHMDQARACDASRMGPWIRN